MIEDGIEIIIGDESESIENVEVEIDVVKVYPELENLEVTPSGEQQVFKPEKYGYETVTVKAVESESLNIVPDVEEQIYSGLYSNVTVAGDSDLAPENIVEDKEIFGVKGNAKTTNAKITNANHLFRYGARLDVMNDLLALCENVISTSNMFYMCNTLKSLDLSDLNMSEVTDMDSMFYSCSNLTSIELDKSDNCKVTDMSNMFYSCSNLTSIDLSNFDASEVTNIFYVLMSCRSLVNLKGFRNLGKGYTQKTTNNSNYTLSLTTCTKLTYESLIGVINNLYDLNLTYDVANGGTLYTQSLVLGSTNKAKLTAEEIAIATNKGWIVS